MPMRVLHMLRTRPDSTMRSLIEWAYPGEDRILVPLCAGAVDYNQLVRQIFDSDRVISWWSQERHSAANKGEANE